MARHRFLAGLGAAAASIAGAVEAQPVVAANPSPAAVSERFGEVRLRIGPDLGEQEAEIRQLLAAYPFVRIGEPADYLITTDPDFPLDLALVALREPREQWQRFVPGDHNSDVVPRRFAIGNLRSEGTAERLGRTLVAASRLRGLLDRSVADRLGIEACLFVLHSSDGWNERQCQPLDELPSRQIVYMHEVGRMRVTNRSGADRYVSTIAIEGNFRSGWFGQEGEPPVLKIAPGETIDFLPRLAGYYHPDHPRVALLVSARSFKVDDFAQPAPLDGNDCSDARPGQSCIAATSPIAVNDDLALLSFQITVREEPRPAMGHGTDVTAAMAVWMAQFYSIVPYTPAEIDADTKLPVEETQFLKLRTYEERQHRCGATLIGPNLVLTAAHCVAKGQYAGDGLPKLLRDRRVRLGTRLLGKGGQSFAIVGVAVHGLYDKDKHNHDLALLLLKPDRGSGLVRQKPIAIAHRPLPGAANALGFGWGFTGAVDPKGNIMMTLDSRVQDNPEVLQYGEMISVTLDQCRKKLAGLVAPGMVCMYSKVALQNGQSADGVFTCRGDSGGPLVRKSGGKDVLVGVVNWSKGCGFKDYPSVFADVGSYAQWIAAARAELKPGMAGPVADPARPVAVTRRN